MAALTTTTLTRHYAGWQRVWLLIAVLSLPLVCYCAYLKSEETDREFRVLLIQRYSLWENDPSYRGKPQTWTRFAARLLNTSQLMERVREKQGELATQIEEDFRRDAVLAQSQIVATYGIFWGMPLALLYGAGWLHHRRKRK